MKPLCDHPSYCKTDTLSWYVGQSHHIAYPPHRNNDSYFPSGILFIFGIVNLIFSFVIGTVNHNLLGGIVLKSKGWKDVRTQKLTGAFCTYTRVRRPANHITLSFKNDSMLLSRRTATTRSARVGTRMPGDCPTKSRQSSRV